MTFETLSDEVRKNVAAQVAALLKASAVWEATGTKRPRENLKLRESCRELILDLPRDWQAGGKLEAFVRPQRTWHHQLGSDTELYGYARTIQRGGESSPHSLIEIIPSARVAAAVESGIQELDAEPQKLERVCARDAELSLLYVPRYDYHAFVPEPTSREEGGWELPGAYELAQQEAKPAVAAEAERAGQSAGALLDRTKLVLRLATLPSAFGVDSRAPRLLQPVGFIDRLKQRLSRLVSRGRNPKVPR